MDHTSNMPCGSVVSRHAEFLAFVRLRPQCVEVPADADVRVLLGVLQGSSAMDAGTLEREKNLRDLARNPFPFVALVLLFWLKIFLRIFLLRFVCLMMEYPGGSIVGFV